MARKKRKIKAGVSLLAVILTAAAVFWAFGRGAAVPAGTAAQSAAASYSFSSRTAPAGLSVHIIDVGQGDSIFVDCEGKTMLIDTGIPEMGPKVAAYLQSYGIKKLDYLVGTHPHSDHIGGMSLILSDFSVGKLMMPKATNNTSVFEDLVNTISEKGLKITAPAPGGTFRLGGAVCTVLAPNRSSYEDLNDMSIVIRLTYKGKSFLFTGDASEPSEADMLAKGYNLKADVLKVGHHGSSSATSDAFLKAVSPRYAVISVGAGNSYGHPAQSTLTKLQAAGAKVLRTDLNGTVVFRYNGKKLTYTTEKG